VQKDPKKQPSSSLERLNQEQREQPRKQSAPDPQKRIETDRRRAREYIKRHGIIPPDCQNCGESFDPSAGTSNITVFPGEQPKTAVFLCRSCMYQYTNDAAFIEDFFPAYHLPELKPAKDPRAQFLKELRTLIRNHIKRTDPTILSGCDLCTSRSDTARIHIHPADPVGTYTVLCPKCEVAYRGQQLPEARNALGAQGGDSE